MEMEARRLHVGQMVGIDPVPVEIRPVDPLTPEQRGAGWRTQVDVERELEQNLARDVTAGLLTPEEVAQASRRSTRVAERPRPVNPIGSRPNGW